MVVVNEWFTSKIILRTELMLCHLFLLNLTNFCNPIQTRELAFPMISPNWISLMTPRLVTFRQII